MEPHDVIEFMWQRLNRHEATCLLNYLVDMTIVLQHLKKPNQKLDASEFPNALKTSFDTLCKLLRKKPSEERKKILQVLFASTKYDRPDLRHEPMLTRNEDWCGRQRGAAGGAGAGGGGQLRARHGRRAERRLRRARAPAHSAQGARAVGALRAPPPLTLQYTTAPNRFLNFCTYRSYLLYMYLNITAPDVNQLLRCHQIGRLTVIIVTSL